MKGYYCRDCDDSWDKDLPLEGKQLTTLFDLCFQYCDYFSMRIRGPEVFRIEDLQKYEIKQGLLEEQYPQIWKKYFDFRWFNGIGKAKYQVHFYRVCSETRTILRDLCDTAKDLWEMLYWGEQHFPDDPVFFRKDDTVFFYCGTHDGYAELFPYDSENVEKLVCDPRWKPIDHERLKQRFGALDAIKR